MRGLSLYLSGLVFLVVLWAAPSAQAAVPDAIYGAKAMVVSAHPEATRIGLEILKEGGNAVDAAVGVAYALSVVEPFSSGIGGGSFTLYRESKEGKVYALDGREIAPAALKTRNFHPNGKYDPKLSRWTGLAVGVPGLVSAMHALHEKFGSRPIETILQRVVEVARKGMVVTPRFAARIKRQESYFSVGAQKVFMVQGRAPEIGSILKQEDQANVIERIAKEGPGAFYEGEIAQKIVEEVGAHGGVMVMDDMKSYKPRWREPIRGTWKGMSVFSFPPPSSGGAVLVRLLNGVGEGANLKASGWNSSGTVHVLAEIMKRAYADRNLLLGDPDFVDVPLEQFVDPEIGRKDREAIGKRATPAKKVLDRKKLIREKSHTSHFSIVDSAGNAVSQTQTINLSFGSGLLAEGTGIVLNNEVDDFATAPGKQNAFGLVQGVVNEVSPGKRPLSSMTPTILEKDGRVEAVVGSPGGSFIITSVFQVILNRYIYGMTASEAVCMPRFHHQWLPDYIQAERYALSADTALSLAKKKHVIHERERFGNVQAIFRFENGWHGAADCRGEGQAMGY